MLVKSFWAISKPLYELSVGGGQNLGARRIRFKLVRTDLVRERDVICGPILMFTSLGGNWNYERGNIIYQIVPTYLFYHEASMMYH